MQKVWFISDLHLSHSSILYFHKWRRDACGVSLDELREDRNKCTEQHDEWLINLWNSTVKKGDFIYIIGDLCLGNKERTERVLSRLHGRKYLIRGNHDKSCNGLERYFEWVGDIKEVKFNHDQFNFIKEGETFCCELCHYPLLSWNRRTHGTCMVHGHCHGSIDMLNESTNELRVDVGFDGSLARSCGGFISLESLYQHFIDKLNKMGMNSFQEYIDSLMEKQGFRM